MTDINVKFMCKQGQELAASDAHHDFENVDDNILKSTIPTCSVKKFTYASEEVELNNIIKYVMGDKFKTETTDLIMKRLVQGGTQESYSEGETIPAGLAYTAYNLGDLEYRSWMSSSSTKNKKVKAKFRKNNRRKPSPIIEEEPITGTLQRTIQENTGLDKVYIIDDIHSTAFTENIKIKANPSQEEAFWCYLQTPQTIFDPAGKITPESKPDIFSSGNVEYAWYDIRPDKSRPINNDDMNTITSEIINYPKLTTPRDVPIIYNREKLMLKNDVYLSIKGNPLDPYSHQVNFFSKIDEGRNVFAVFDNRSSAIKNRNYMSTNIKGPINNALDSIKTSKLTINIGMKAHFVAKRFGDQGQANVTCNPSIPIIQKTDNVYTATKTTGNHIFVSKDRLAIGAALLYNSPMILHLKAGSPKNNLHNILYIRNDLIQSSESQQAIEVNKINTQIRALNAEKTRYWPLFIRDFETQLREQLAKFRGIVENRAITSVVAYIATVEANTAAFIQCKITENKLLSNTTPEILTEIPTMNGVEDKIVFRNMINEMETKIADTSNIYSNITEIEILIAGNVFGENGTMYINNSNREDRQPPITTKRRTSSRRKIDPTNISGLRQIWKPVFDRIYMYETVDSDISNAFSTTCVALTLPNDDQARLVGILEQYNTEIVRETAFNDLASRGFATQTTTLTREEIMRKWIESGTSVLDIKETGIIRDWINSRGNTLGESLSERQFIGDFLDRNSDMAVPSWITELKRNKLGQFESSRLLDLQFARLVYAYFNPKIINYGLHVVDKLNSEFLEYYRNKNPREFTSGGFASDLYYGYEDLDTFDEDLENDVKYYTEMDYFNRAYKYSDPKSELLSITLEILWRSQNIKDSISKFEENVEKSLFEEIKQETRLDPEIHLVADSGNKDLDPVVQMNNYAIDRLFTSSNEDQVDDTESWKINDDASTRIIFKKDGIMKRSCGFYRNCIQPTLTDLDNQRK